MGYRSLALPSGKDFLAQEMGLTEPIRLSLTSAPPLQDDLFLIAESAKSDRYPRNYAQLGSIALGCWYIEPVLPPRGLLGRLAIATQ
jgi:hypothetical protein